MWVVLCKGDALRLRRRGSDFLAGALSRRPPSPRPPPIGDRGPGFGRGQAHPREPGRVAADAHHPRGARDGLLARPALVRAALGPRHGAPSHHRARQQIDARRGAHGREPRLLPSSAVAVRLLRGDLRSAPPIRGGNSYEYS